MKTKAPNWIIRILHTFCPDSLVEEIEGDLIQRFERDVLKIGLRKAKRRLIWNTIRFFRPGVITRNKFTMNNNSPGMVGHYVTFALRGIGRHRVFSMINIAGLAVSMIAFVLIVQYISFETSYDQLSPNSNNVYRIASTITKDGQQITSAKAFIGIRQVLKDNFPEITNYTGISPIPANIGFSFRYKDKSFLEPGRQFRVDSAFFDVFRDRIVKGDRRQTFRDTHNLLLSESMAKKIFGEEDPVNQTLVDISDHLIDGDFVVTGVFKDFPENTHFHTDFIGPIETGWDTVSYHWDTPSFHTYVELPDGVDPLFVETRLNSILKEIQKEHAAIQGASVFLQPLNSIHLESNLNDELETNGSFTMIYIIATVGFLIMVIAWINYINLETANFITQQKEIGIRRVIGSSKTDLILQFLVKYISLNVIAGVIAIIAIKLLLPRFEYLTGTPIHNISLLSPEVWMMASVFFICGSFIVGIYPALFMVRMNPADNIRKNFTGGGNNNFLRRSLVVVQFTVSVVIVAFLMVIIQQLDFMRQSDKNIELHRIVTMENSNAYDNAEFSAKRNEYKAFENMLLATSMIEQVSSSSAIPGNEIGFNLINEMKRNLSDPHDPTPFKLLFVNYNFLPLHELKLKAGRNYSETNSNDFNPEQPFEHMGRIILNESAIQALGFKSAEDAIGQNVEFKLFPSMKPQSEIIGVVQDYNHESVKRPVYPMIFFPNQGAFQQVYYSVKIREGVDQREAIQAIEKTWKEVFPGKPFNYFFLDDHYDRQFKSELHYSRVFVLFAGIAVFLAALGILGMTLFEANARLREISIRKVLGASVTNIVTLLSGGHVKVMMVSTVIGTPLIWFACYSWLNHYPVRIEVTPAIYLIPLASVFGLLIVVAAFQTIRAAFSNPMEHLKNE